MDKFLDKYRIPSARAKWWNYNANGIYFITICTSGHDYYFGQIINKQMVLSEIGLLVQKEWEKSFIFRKELQCDIFVIMPNHIHTILRIENDNPVETHGGAYFDSNNLPVKLYHDAYFQSYDLLCFTDAPPCVSTAIQYNPNITNQLKITELRTVLQNQFHHLWQVLNRL